MPSLRIPPIVVTLLIASAGCAMAAASQENKAAPKGPDLASIPTIEFYLAKGGADACGPGCSLWIAAEGKIDVAAASRLGRLLAKLGRPRPPIYFHSPGGSVDGSLALGRLLREQKLEVSVGHTVPLGCDPEKTQEKSCEALKHSGQAVEAQFDALHTMCNSGCVYVLAGGTVRHVPPWVKLGVHDVGIDPAVTVPRGLIQEAKAVNHQHIENFLRDMGIDDGLFKAAFAIPFESKRFLERDEVARFGIDRREFDEIPWQYVDKPAPMLIKGYFARTDDARVRYLDGAVTVNCTSGQSLRLGLEREHAVTDISGAEALPVSISVNGQRIELRDQFSPQQIEMHSASLSRSVLDAVSDDAMLGLSAADLARNKLPTGEVMLSMRGFSAAYAKWRTSCDEYVRSADTWLRNASAGWVSPKPAASTNALSIGQLSLPGSSVGWPSTKAAPAKPSVTDPRSTPSSANAAGPPASAPQGCNLRIADKPEHLKGRVTAFLSAEDALSRTQKVEAELGAEISPAYIALDRVIVKIDNRSAMVAVPKDMTVRIGDLVELNTRYLDQAQPCHFIPWMIDRHIDSGE